MTTIELRTSISADLDLLSPEMLENVSRYVKRLAHRSRSSKTALRYSSRMEEALKFVETLSVRGSQQVPADEGGVDALIDEKYSR